MSVAMPTVLRLAGEMTIYQAAEQKQELVQALAEAGSGLLEIDLSAVSEIDVAGLQLLLAARNACERRGSPLRLIEPSPAVREVFALANAAAHFGTAWPEGAQ